MRKLSLVFLVVVIGFFSNQAFGQQLSEIQFVSGSQIEILSNGTATLDVSTAASTGGSIHIYTKSTTTTGIYVASSSNYVGIGTATPDYKLEVNIGATAAYPLELVSSGRYLRIGALNSSYAHFDTDATGGFYFYDPVFLGTGNSKLNLSSGDSYLAASGGKVGIGTSNPSSTLHVVTASGNAATFSSAITIGYPSAATDAARKDYVDSLFGIQHWVQSGSYLYTSSTAWNVGIGTATPATKLDVYGTETGNRISQGGSGIPYTELIQRSWGGDNAILFGAYGTSSYANGDLLFAGNTRHKYASSSFGSADHRAKMIMADHTSIGFYISNTSGGVGQNVTWNQELLISPSNIYIPTNSVGIGEVSPGSTLSVSGGATIGSSYDTTAAPANGLLVQGNMGVGTTNPGASLQIGASSAGTGYVRINPNGGWNEYYNTESYPRVVLSRDGAGAGVSALQFGGGSSAVDSTLQRTVNGAGFAFIGGNVGIGTTTPNAKLDVNGAVNIVGSSAHNLRIAQSNQPASYFFDLDVDTAVNGRLNIKNQLGSEIFSISRDGVVGIGTTTPVSKLDVYGGDIQVETGMGRFKGWYNAGSGLAAEIGISGGSGYIIAYNRTTSAYYPINLSTGTNVLSLPTSGPATLNNGLTVTGTVTATQFVGGGAGLTGITATDSTKVAKAGDTMSGALTVSASVGSGSTGVLNVTNAIDSGSSGTYFGAKITGPTATYTNGSVATSTALYLTGGNTGDANNKSYALQAVAGSGTGSEYAAYFSGNVGINTTTPGGALDVASAGTAAGYWLDGKAAVTGESADNWLRINQNSSWTNGVYVPSVLRTDGGLISGAVSSAGAGTIRASSNIHSAGTIGGAGTTGTAGTYSNTWRLGNNGVSAPNSWLYLLNGTGAAYHDLALGNIWITGAISNVNAITQVSGIATLLKTNLMAAGSGWDDGLNLYSNDGTNRWNYLVDNGASDSMRIAYNNTEVMHMNTAGSVGVGTASPDGFQVNKATTETADGSDNVRLGVVSGVPRILFEDNGSTIWSIDNSAGTLRFFNPGFVRMSLTTTGTLTVNKVNAAEVDPPYTINGKKYATYMAGMTGLKEETTGVVALKNGKAVLDIVSAPEGSDLWMFAQTINIEARDYLSDDGKIYRTSVDKIMNGITILLTPNFDGKTWYEKENGKIIIYASPSENSKFKIQNSKLEVSYRLTAPRFDAAKKDGNLRTGDEVEGLNLDKLLK